MPFRPPPGERESRRGERPSAPPPPAHRFQKASSESATLRLHARRRRSRGRYRRPPGYRAGRISHERRDSPFEPSASATSTSARSGRCRSAISTASAAVRATPHTVVAKLLHHKGKAQDDELIIFSNEKSHFTRHSLTPHPRFDGIARFIDSVDAARLSSIIMSGSVSHLPSSFRYTSGSARGSSGGTEMDCGHYPLHSPSAGHDPPACPDTPYFLRNLCDLPE